jgi:hypothetical protein
MSDLDPSGITEIIRRAIASYVNDIHVSIPGQVQAYDSSTQTVDVLPMVRRPLPTLEGETVYEDLPVLPGMRVSFQRAGEFSITFPLKPGDEGMIMIAGWDFSAWMASGQVSDPLDLRNHHPNHSFFLPGVCSDKSTIKPDPGTDALVIAGPDVRLGALSASDAVALAGAAFDFIKGVINAGAPAAGDGGAALKSTMLAYITTHTSPNPFAALQVKAK